jgi:RNA polymerase sigma factor (sigma-70 family)
MSALEFNTHLTLIQKSLFPFALTLTRNSEEAQDLCQETLLKALKYKDKFKTDTNIKAWVYTIMRNTFFNAHKKQNLTNNLFANSETLDYITNDSSYSPEVYYNTNEIESKIESLNETYRIPFMLHTSGYKYHEISEELNLPIGTIKSRIFYARKILAQTLHDYIN